MRGFLVLVLILLLVIAIGSYLIDYEHDYEQEHERHRGNGVTPEVERLILAPDTGAASKTQLQNVLM